jgi:hypothetical protein
MPMSRTISRALRSAATAVALLTAASHGRAAAQASAPAVRVLASVAADSGGGTRVELRLARAAATPPVGSFVGEVTFDAAAFTLAGGSVPRGLTVAWNAVALGCVRFAGASLEGFGDDPVLVLRFTGRPPSTDAFHVRVTEAFAVNGRVRLAP